MGNALACKTVNVQPMKRVVGGSTLHRCLLLDVLPNFQEIDKRLYVAQFQTEDALSNGGGGDEEDGGKAKE